VAARGSNWQKTRCDWTSEKQNCSSLQTSVHEAKGEKKTSRDAEYSAAFLFCGLTKRAYQTANRERKNIMTTFRPRPVDIEQKLPILITDEKEFVESTADLDRRGSAVKLGRHSVELNGVSDLDVQVSRVTCTQTTPILCSLPTPKFCFFRMKMLLPLLFASWEGVHKETVTCPKILPTFGRDQLTTLNTQVRTSLSLRICAS